MRRSGRRPLRWSYGLSLREGELVDVEVVRAEAPLAVAQVEPPHAPEGLVEPELLQALAPFTSGLNVMNYQTDVQKIYRSAVPFLDWSATHGKQVKIALEGRRPPYRSTMQAITLAGQHVIVHIVDPAEVRIGAGPAVAKLWIRRDPKWVPTVGNGPGKTK